MWAFLSDLVNQILDLFLKVIFPELSFKKVWIPRLDQIREHHAHEKKKQL